MHPFLCRVLMLAKATEAAAAVAASAKPPLTVVEFGDGRLAAALLGSGGATGVEEVVVCGHHVAAAMLPPGATAWSNSCTTGAQLSLLRRALIKGQRPRVAIVSSWSCSAALALRLLQLYHSLPPACLLFLAADPPAPVKSVQKSVFCALPHTTLAAAQLPKPTRERHLVWVQFLADSLLGAATSASPSASEQSEALLDGEQGLLIARRQPRAAAMAVGHDEGLRLFPPVALGPVEQLAALRALVDAAVERQPTSALSGGGPHVRLVRSSSSRYEAGGYSALHYVPQPPSPHAAAYELEIVAGEGIAGGERIGYIALLAYGVDKPSLTFPTAVPHRTLHAAEVARLVVLPHWRRTGAKEALLSACSAFTELGYPVRVKTGSERVHSAFLRCELLAYEGHRAAGTTSCGVRRPMKRYARVLAAEGAAASGGEGSGGPEVGGEVVGGDCESGESASVSAGDGERCGGAGRGGGAALSVSGGEDASGGDGRDGRDGCWRIAEAGADATVMTMAEDGVQQRPRAAAGDESAPWRPSRLAGVPGGMPGGGTTRGNDPQHAPHHAEAAAARAGVPRSARSLINKLSADNFEKVVPQLATAAMADEAALRSCLGLLFARAAREPMYCSLYASVCDRLAKSSASQGATRVRVPACAENVAGGEGIVVGRAAFLDQVESELRALLERCAQPEHLSGTGSLAAELVIRRLVPTSRLRALLSEAPPRRLCAFLARAGATLRVLDPATLGALAAAVSAAAREATGRDGRENSIGFIGLNVPELPTCARCNNRVRGCSSHEKTHGEAGQCGAGMSGRRLVVDRNTARHPLSGR